MSDKASIWSKLGVALGVIEEPKSEPPAVGSRALEPIAASNAADLADKDAAEAKEAERIEAERKAAAEKASADAAALEAAAASLAAERASRIKLQVEQLTKSLDGTGASLRRDIGALYTWALDGEHTLSVAKVGVAEDAPEAERFETVKVSDLLANIAKAVPKTDANRHAFGGPAAEIAARIAGGDTSASEDVNAIHFEALKRAEKSVKPSDPTFSNVYARELAAVRQERGVANA